MTCHAQPRPCLALTSGYASTDVAQPSSTSSLQASGWVQTERYHALAEERKRDKEQAKSRRDKLQTVKDIEARAEAGNLPAVAKPSAAQLADAQLLRHEACPPRSWRQHTADTALCHVLSSWNVLF